MARTTGVLASDPAMQRSDCSICGREPGQPFIRRNAANEIVAGCIGGIHEVAATQFNPGYSAWWRRRAAVQLRLDERRARLGR